MKNLATLACLLICLGCSGSDSSSATTTTTDDTDGVGTTDDVDGSVTTDDAGTMDDADGLGTTVDVGTTDDVDGSVTTDDTNTMDDADGLGTTDDAGTTVDADGSGTTDDTGTTDDADGSGTTGDAGTTDDPPADPCDPNPCQNTGSCTADNDAAVCDCTGTGFSGATCTLLPCEEFDPQGNGTDAWKWSCYLPKPCGTARLIEGAFAGGTTGGPVDDYWSDPEAVQCVIDAFKAGKAVRIRLKKGDEIGQFVKGHLIDLLDATRGVELSYIFNDSPDGAGIKRRQMLKPPEYFDSCAAMQSDAEMYDCLINWSEGCLDDADVCPE